MRVAAIVEGDGEVAAVPLLLRRLANWRTPGVFAVVIAKREYEAWFIAAAESLHGWRGFAFDPAERIDAETPRDAKGWLRQRLAAGIYGETTDQPAFTARFDLQQAFDGSRSFRKLCKEWDIQAGRPGSERLEC